jgi:hypothetical protein
VREMLLPWSCDACHAEGTVRYPAGEDPVSIHYRIEEAHAIANPDCHADNGFLRIRFGEPLSASPQRSLFVVGR